MNIKGNTNKKEALTIGLSQDLERVSKQVKMIYSPKVNMVVYRSTVILQSY